MQYINIGSMKIKYIFLVEYIAISSHIIELIIRKHAINNPKSIFKAFPSLFFIEKSKIPIIITNINIIGLHILLTCSILKYLLFNPCFFNLSDAIFHSSRFNFD